MGNDSEQTHPKIVQDGNVVKRRYVRVSFVEEPFSIPVRTHLLKKLKNVRDDDNNEFIFLGLLAGDETRVTNQLDPTDDLDPTTDVIVLLSDEYPGTHAGKSPIAVDAKEPEFNYYLNLANRTPELSVWLGVVQEMEWNLIWVEGARLERFRKVLHELRPGHTRFIDQAGDPNVLDKAVADAVRLLVHHDRETCTFCTRTSQPSAPPPDTAAPRSAKTGGFLGRFRSFLSKGST